MDYVKDSDFILSIIIACYDVERTKKILSKFIDNNENKSNIEFIIGYDSSIIDVASEIKDIELSELGKINIKTIPCHKLTSNYETILSKNEIFIQCSDKTSGVYTVLTSDYFIYEFDFFDKCLSYLSNDGADLYICPYVVNWPNKTQAMYDVLNSGDFSITGYLIESSTSWWHYCTENKIIRSKIARNALNYINTYYKNKTSHFILDDLIITTEIFSKTKKVEIINDVYCVHSWSDEDSLIRIYSEDNSVEKYSQEADNVIDWIQNNYNVSEQTKPDIKLDKIFVNNLISLFVWRYDWAFKGLASYYTNRYPDLKTFELHRLDGKSKLINIESSSTSTKVEECSNETDSNLKINIFVSMHKESYIPKNNRLIKAIQVGTEMAEYKFKNTIHDNDCEDNISLKNKMYCEMTAQYYVWKNVKNLDYYGFWHYRRYFSFNNEETDNEYGFIPHKSLNEESLKKSFIDEEHILNYCKNYDIIVPRKWHCVEDKEYTVYEHWQKHFNINDLNATISVIKDKFPEFYRSAIETIYSSSAIFCNMFIMSKKYFLEYNDFCFKVLFEVEKIIDQKKYNTEEYRTLGHIGERLLAIYVNYVESNDHSARICYTGRTHYADTRQFIDEIPHPVHLFNDLSQLNYASQNSSVYKDNINKLKFYKEHTNKCVSVMLSSSDYFMKYTDVLLESIKENSNNETFYDIVICHTHISMSNQEIAKNIFKSSDNILLRFFDVSKNFEKYNSLRVNRNFTFETYFRFLILDLFKGYDRLLYLDCDTVVNCDLESLFNIQMDNEYIAAVRDYDFIANSQKNQKFYYDNIIKYIKLDSNFNYFQAGVILFNLKNIQNFVSSSGLFQIALSRNWFYHDQDVLNCVFNKHVKFIDDRWNVFTLLDTDSERSKLLTYDLVANFAQSYSKSRSNPFIVHYAGVPKPWETSHVDLDVYFWKYARSSPFYEVILSEKLNGLGIMQDWILFTSDKPSNLEVSNIPFFRINTVKQNWTNDYCVIDFIYLSDHKETLFNTLYISMSMFPHETEGSWLDVKQFFWKDSSIPVFNNVFYRVTRNCDLDLYVNFINKYEGFSFKVSQLESRSIQKPYISIINHHYVTI